MQQFHETQSIGDALGHRTAVGVVSRMPIRRKESDIFPDDLFDMPIAEAPWEIAHLRSRQEKSVARLLLDSRNPFYLPQIQQKKKSGGRTFVSHLPLFPGYIFLRRVPGVRETLRRTNVIANLLEVPDQARLTSELLQIRTLQISGATLTPYDELAPGDAVDAKCCRGGKRTRLLRAGRRSRHVRWRAARDI